MIKIFFLFALLVDEGKNMAAARTLSINSLKTMTALPFLVDLFWWSVVFFNCEVIFEPGFRSYQVSHAVRQRRTLGIKSMWLLSTLCQAGIIRVINIWTNAVSATIKSHFWRFLSAIARDRYIGSVGSIFCWNRNHFALQMHSTNCHTPDDYKNIIIISR